MPDPLGTGGEKFIQHARVESAGRDRIDVDVVRARLFGECFDETDDGRLGCRVGAQHGQRIRGAAARQLDDFAALCLLEVRQQPRGSASTEPRRLISIVRIHSCQSTLSIAPMGPATPALLTRMSRRPNSASAPSTSRRHIRRLGDIGGQRKHRLPGSGELSQLQRRLGPAASRRARRSSGSRPLRDISWRSRNPGPGWRR